jgi:hypothetical protein
MGDPVAIHDLRRNYLRELEIAREAGLEAVKETLRLARALIYCSIATTILALTTTSINILVIIRH